MPARFDSLGISFQYPDNWTLDDADARLGRGSVTVYSPGGAFWSVTVHSDPIDPAEPVDAVVEAMREEYDELEVKKTSQCLAGHELIGYDLAFYCLDLTNTAHVRGLRTPQATYTVYCQAEDREYQQNERVFEAITVSFLGSLKGLRDLG